MATIEDTTKSLPLAKHRDASTPAMPLSSRQQASLAALLPEEILTHIFELAIDVSEDWESYDQNYDTLPSISSLAALTTVCKSWLQPARRAFYKDLSGTALHEWTWPALLYEQLQHTSPSPGRLVRNFDPGDIFQESGGITFVYIVQTMPYLRELSIYTHHIQRLCECNNWDNLRSLFVKHSHRLDGCIAVEASQMPAKLKSLGMEGLVDIFSSTEEDRLQLPHIRSAKITGTRHSPPKPALFLPSMPNLETLECIGSLKPDYLYEIVKDFSSSLKRMSIHQTTKGPFPLNPSAASQLKNLELLEYNGTMRSYDGRVREDCFPANLRRLDIAWKGWPQHGMDLLGLLTDGKFLPKLEECPRIAFTVSPPRPAEEALEEYTTYYIEASKAYKVIMLRPKIVHRESLRYQHRYTSADEVFCLPSPLPYLGSLHPQTQEMLEILKASGQVSGYSA